MRSGSVIIGDLSDGHLMCGRRTVDLAYRHLAEGAHQAALPFGWQRLPDRTGQPIAHRVIQASAPRRTALEYRVSAVRRFVSNYQRRLLWDIELFFRWVKQTLKIKKFLGVSENAVRIQVAVALIAFLLLRLAKQMQTAPTSPLMYAQVVRTNLMHLRGLTALEKPPERRPRIVLCQGLPI
jgi:hypothetical protein